MGVEHKQSRTEDARSESSMRKSSVEKEMKTSRRSSFESEKNEQSSTLERKTGQKINVERSSSIVPMNLRNTFFDDPFFQDNWLDIQQSQKNFFSQAEEEFQKRMDLMESSMNERFSLSKFFDMDMDKS